MKEVLFGNGLNPQPEIQKHSETADWEYQEPAALMYHVGKVMMERFFNGLVYLDGKKVPDPLIAFDNLRNNNVLAQYDLRPDEYGLMFKITHNTEHFIDVNGKKEYKYGNWALAEVQLHEMIHAWQQHGRGKDPYKSGRNTHNKEFVRKAKELGLNVVPVVGSHYQIADEGSPFAILMRQLGFARPSDIPRIDRNPKDDWFEIGKKRKGRSSLTKWSCGCQNAWIGASEFYAQCSKCGNEFVQATAARQILKELANAPPEEPEKPAQSTEKDDSEYYDIDLEIDRRQEKEWLYHEPDETDGWEDPFNSMDQFS